MALGEWLSVQSSRELYQHQIGIEKRELEQMPEEEMEELALIYQAKGIAPEEARRLAERLLSDEATALDTLAAELGIDPAELGGSAGGGHHFIHPVRDRRRRPGLPLHLLVGTAGIVASTIASILGLFAIGAAITLMTGRNPLVSGLRQVAFGLAAAAITFGIGRIIGVSVG
jgi:VIT1/CCC1 family predicted Fe2+/Mn2+ transporter